MKSLQQCFKQCKNSTYYAQNMKFQIANANFKQLQIKNKDLPTFVVKCPQIKIHLQQEIINKLKNDLNKSKKSRQGLLIGKKLLNGVVIIQQIRYINSNEEEDVGACQVSEEALCIGFFIQKQQNYEAFIKRFTSQLTKCIQTKLQVVFSKALHQQSRSQLNQIQKTLFKHLRCFITLEQKQSYINLTKTLFMPDIKFLLREVYLNPLKFCQTEAYTKAIKFQKKYQYGYLSLSVPKQKQKMNQVRFVMIDRSDPGQNAQTKIDTMIGLWVAVQKFSSKQQQKTYFWTIIIQYLRNQSIKKKSINIPRSGILFMVQKPRKSSSFIFQIPEQSKWLLNYQPQTIQVSNTNMKFPEQIIFSDQQIIFEQDKQQSQIESLANKSLVRNGNSHMSYYSNLPQQQIYQSYLYNTNNPCDMSLSKSSVDNRSVKSNQQKDLQISLLKKQLEFYKARCQMLQKMVNNPSLPMMQLQQFQLMSQMNNPLLNPMAMNNHNPQFQMQYHNNNSPNNNPYNFTNFNNINSNNSIPMMRNQNSADNDDQNNNSGNNFYNKNQKNLQLHKSNSSPSSTTNQQSNRILQDSQYQEQNKPPQPILPLIMNMNKDMAFNKKKTIQYQYQQQQEEHNFNNEYEHQELQNYNDKNSKPKTRTNNFNKQMTKSPIKLKNPQNQILSNTRNDHYVEVEYQDYKNISFAQQNQFQERNFLSSGNRQKKDQNPYSQFANQLQQSQIFGKSPQFKSINSQNKYKEVIEFSFDSKDKNCQSFGSSGNTNNTTTMGENSKSNKVNVSIPITIPTKEKQKIYHNNQNSNKNESNKVLKSSDLISDKKFENFQEDYLYQQIDDIKTVKSSQKRLAPNPIINNFNNFNTNNNNSNFQNRKYLQRKQPESPDKLFKRIQRQKKYLNSNSNKDFENSPKDSQQKSIPTMTKIQKESTPRFEQDKLSYQKEKDRQAPKQTKQKERQKQKKMRQYPNKAGSDSDDQDMKRIIEKRKKQKLK